MNAPILLAQLLTSGRGEPPGARAVTVSKPQDDQAVVLKVDGATRIDLTAIASESITLVRVGDRLVVLFDNRGTVALEPFFNPDGQPQGDLRLQIAPDRVVDGAQFAALFPVTADQSILPAAGESAPGSSPYFSRGFTIDQLGGGGGPLDLLAASGGAGAAGGATGNRTVNTSPTIGNPDAADLDDEGLDEGLIGGEGDVPGAPTAFTGSLDVAFGNQFVGRTLEFTRSQAGLEGLTSNGRPVQITITTVDGVPTLIGHTGDPSDPVFTISLHAAPIDGAYTITLFKSLDHAERGTENDLVLEVGFIARDGDGDSARGTFTITLDDDTPEARGAMDASVDEDGVGGNAGEPVDPSYDGTDLAGEPVGVRPRSLGIDWGADRDTRAAGDTFGRTLAFDMAGGVPVDGADVPFALTSDGVALVYEVTALDNGGQRLVAYKGTVAAGNEVFSAILDPTAQNGAYTFVLLGNLDHAALPANTENDLPLQFGFIATDADGDPVKSTFTVTVDDDAPVTNLVARQDVEEAAGTPRLGNIPLDIAWGADDNISGAADRTLTFTGSPAAANVQLAGPAGPLTGLTSNGEPVEFTLIGGVLVAYAGAAPTDLSASTIVFIVTLSDVGSGSYSFELRRPIDHLAPQLDHHFIGLTFTYAASDADGDMVTGTFAVTLDAAGTITPAGDSISYASLSTGVFVNLSGLTQTVAGEIVEADTAVDRTAVTDKVVGIDSLGTDLVHATGGAGDDIIVGGSEDNILAGGGGEDRLHGGAGADILTGGFGDDILRGDRDRDRFVHVDGDGLDDVLGGETGDDVDTVAIAGSAADDNLQVILTGSEAIAARFVATGGGVDAAEIERVEVDGGAGTDRLEVHGTATAERIVLTSDLNAASVAGITLIVAQNFERIRIEGQGGADVIDASGYIAHGVILRGNGNADTIIGSGQDDDIDGGIGNDVIDAGAGDDLVVGDRGDDEIQGGSGEDDLAGSDGDDTLRGGGDDDTLRGDAGSDRLIYESGWGVDTLVGGEDTGGTDVDTAELHGSDNSQLTEIVLTGVESFTADFRDVGAAVPPDPKVIASEIERIEAHGGVATDVLLVRGSSGGDRITLTSDMAAAAIAGTTLIAAQGYEFASLTSGDGADTVDASGYGAGVDVDGEGGDDAVEGGAGQDILRGGASSDRLIYRAGGGLDQLIGGEDTGGTDVDTAALIGTDDADTLTIALSGAESFTADFAAVTGTEVTASEIERIEADGGAADDDLVIAGSTGADKVVLTSSRSAAAIGGATLIVAEEFQTARINLDEGDDVIDASGYTAHGVAISGGEGNDEIIGTGQADELEGGAGDDTVRGGSGSDTLKYATGEGLDRLIGGEDAGGGDVDSVELAGTAAADRLEITLTAAEAFTADFGVAVETEVTASEIERIVASGGAGASGDALSVQGSGNADRVVLTDDAGAAAVAGTTLIVASGFDTVTVTGQGGDDVIDASGYARSGVTVQGDDGDDQLIGSGQSDTIEGGAGDDSLQGSAGTDILDGGADSDRLIYRSGWGRSQLIGGETVTSGTDLDTAVLTGTDGDEFLAIAFTGAETFTADFGSPGLPEVTASEIERIEADGAGGTDDSLELTGSDDPDRITLSSSAAAGAVVLEARNFETVRINGQGGDDVIDASGYTDQGITIHGGNGADDITGTGLDDVLFGDDGDDTVRGGEGDDILSGGAGSDRLIYQAGWGLDHLDGGDGGVDVDTAALIGTSGDNSVYVELTGLETFHAAIGAGGPHVMAENIERVELDGAGGNDDLEIFVATGGSRLRLTSEANPGPALGWNVIAAWNFESVTLTGQAGDDGIDASGYTAHGIALTGGDGADVLIGTRHDDIIEGGAGGDILRGGAGRDRLDGGAGSDRLVYEYGGGIDELTGGEDAGGTDLDTVALIGSTGNDSLEIALTGPEAFTASFDGGAGTQVTASEIERIDADGGAGTSDSLTLRGSGDADRITLTSTLAAAAAAGTISALNFEAVSILGEGGDDVIDASAYTARGLTLSGGDGADTLTGTGLDDVIDGDAGNDTIRGGVGNDTVRGGFGSDRLIYQYSWGIDALTGGEDADGRDRDVAELIGTDSADTLSIVLTDPQGFTADFGVAAGTEVTGSEIEVIDVAGGAADDHLLVQGTGNADLIFLASTNTVPFGDTRAIQAQGFESVSIDGGDGDDQIDASLYTAHGVALSGGGGADRLSGTGQADTLAGGLGGDTLDGNAGADTLQGDQGDDVLRGGADADRLIYQVGWGLDQLTGGEAGVDADTAVLTGSSGNDRLSITLTGPESFTADFGAAAGDEVTATEIERIEASGGDGAADELTVGGSSTADRIILTSDVTAAAVANTTLIAAQSFSSVTIRTREGADIVDASGYVAPGVTIYGEAGDDDLTGGSQRDTLLGGDGRDTLRGGKGDDDDVFGDADADRLVYQSGWGLDRLDGGGSITTGQDVDTVELVGTLAPDDLMIDVTGTETFRAGFNGTSQDVDAKDIERIEAVGSGNNDRLTVREVIGGGSWIVLTSDIAAAAVAGATLIAAKEFESATIDGGAGADVIDASGYTAHGLTIKGNAGDDELTGGTQADEIYGGAGNDVLSGAGGNDRLEGQGDSDRLTYRLGSSGLATLVGGEDAGDVDVDTVEVIGTGANELVRVALSGRESFQVDNANTTVAAATQIERIELDGGSGNNDELQVIATNGVAGRIVLTSDLVAAAVADKTLIAARNFERTRIEGQGGGDLIDASGYVGTNVELSGQGGNDQIVASAGDDTMLGGAGSDRLVVRSAGVHTLLGGEGADVDTAALVGRDQADALEINVTGAKTFGFNFAAGTNTDVNASEIERIEIDGGAGADGLKITLNNGGGTVLLSSDMAEAAVAGTTVMAVQQVETVTIEGQGDANIVDASRYGGIVEARGRGGADQITGGSAGDALFGDEGNDILDGRGGDDFMSGGQGDDLFLHMVGDGFDEIEGGVESGTTSPAYDILRLTGDGTARTFTIGTKSEASPDNIAAADDKDDVTVSYGGTNSGGVQADEIERIEIVFGSAGDKLVTTDVSATHIAAATIAATGGAGSDEVDVRALKGTAVEFFDSSTTDSDLVRLAGKRADYGVTFSDGVYTISKSGIGVVIKTKNVERFLFAGENGGAGDTIPVADLINAAPTAVADAGTVIEAGGLRNATAGDDVHEGNVLTNDTDPNRLDAKYVTSVTFGAQTTAVPDTGSITIAGTYGALTISADGTYRYVLNDADMDTQQLDGGETKADTFGYTIRDAGGLTSQSSLVITVTGANDTPVITAQPTQIETAEDTPVAITGFDVVDVDDPTQWANLTLSVGSGSLLWDGVDKGRAFTVTGAAQTLDSLIASGRVTFVPAANFHGDVTLTLTIDQNGVPAPVDTQTVTLKVTSVNDTPTAQDHAVQASEAVQTTGNLLTGATDVDSGQTLRLASIDLDGAGGAPAIDVTVTGDTWQTIDLGDGTLEVQADGDFRFTGDAGFVGRESFSYSISDGAGGADTAKVTVDVAPVVDAFTVSLAGGAVVPVGPDATVGSTTAGADRMATVTAIAGGGYVVAWASQAEDLTWDVYAQRYDAAGVSQGDPMRVNTGYLLNTQDSPSIARLDGGSYVITWSSFNQDGDGYGVYAQRFNADGVAQGAAFQVNTTTALDQDDASVTAIDGGGFVVTWRSGSNALGRDVYTRRYDASGNAETSETLVNITTTNSQQDPAVVRIDGGYVVVWSSINQDGSGSGVYARRYSATGSALDSETLVNSTTANNQQDPAVATIDGGYVITWASVNQDGSGMGIYAQRYTAQGAKIGTETLVNTTVTDNQSEPAVMAVDGGYVIVWQSNNQDGSGSGIYGQRYLANGTAVGAEFRINSDSAGSQEFINGSPGGRIAFTDADLLVAVWDDATAGTVEQRLFRLPTEDTPFGTPIVVTLTDTDGSEHVHRVVLSGFPSGAQFTVDGVVAGHLDPNGTWVLDEPTADQLARLTLVPPLNYNGTFTFTVAVTVRDEVVIGGNALSDDRTVSTSTSIVVAPVNDLPMVTGLDNASVLNNQAGAVVDGFTVGDVDGGTLSFRVLNGSGVVDGRFVVEATSGTTSGQPGGYQLRLANGQALTADATVNVEVSDGAGGVTTVPVTITAASAPALDLVFRGEPTTMTSDPHGLEIRGTDGNDVLNVVVSGSTVTSVNGSAVTNGEIMAVALGSGSDTLSYAGTTTDVQVNLDSTAFPNQSATGLTTIPELGVPMSVDHVVGGSGNDTITGYETGGNSLEGGAGNDILSGLGGDDDLRGGSGADMLDGGTGVDRFWYDNSSDGGDSIRDFATGTDSVMVKLGENGFGLELDADDFLKGVLKSDRFVDTAKNSNEAQTSSYAANQHFIFFDHPGGGTSELYFDPTPTSAGTDRVLLARLENGADLDFGDIKSY